jgi:hypothetical protein
MIITPSRPKGGFRVTKQHEIKPLKELTEVQKNHDAHE